MSSNATTSLTMTDVGTDRRDHCAAGPQTGGFCHGDTPTMADICLASIVEMVRIFKIAISNTPTINRIMDACDAHTPFVKAKPSR